MLARTSALLVFGIPGAGAPVAVIRPAYDVFGVATADVGGVPVESDRAYFDECRGVPKAGVHRCEPLGVVRQFAVEVGGFSGVVPDPPSRAEPAHCPGDALLSKAGLGGESRDLDAWFEGQQGGDQVRVVGGLLVGQIPEHPPLLRRSLGWIRG